MIAVKLQQGIKRIEIIRFEYAAFVAGLFHCQSNRLSENGMIVSNDHTDRLAIVQCTPVHFATSLAASRNSVRLDLI
ncbi:MAG: hypothetical protein Tsb0027_07030 [Wenzhouxiangellaceae bacterium]